MFRERTRGSSPRSRSHSGRGLSGWVLENNKPIVNGNPGVEPGYLNDAAKFTTLCSALAMPLRPPGGMRGVLALYALEKESFSKDQLEIILSIETVFATAVGEHVTLPPGERHKRVPRGSLLNARASNSQRDGASSRWASMGRLGGR